MGSIVSNKIEQISEIANNQMMMIHLDQLLQNVSSERKLQIGGGRGKNIV